MRKKLNTSVKNLFKRITKRQIDIPLNVPLRTTYKSNIDQSTLNQIKKYRNENINIPSVINGKEYITSHTKAQICPYNINETVCNYNVADESLLKEAIRTHKEGRSVLKKLNLQDKKKIFNKVADMFSNNEKYRTSIQASTIYGQGKTVHQAEIDAVAELADFLNFNAYYLEQLESEQPYSLNATDAENYSNWNPLNGFVASITPFNFTAIGANLATVPLLMGNPVIWKPSDNAVLSNYVFYQALLEAGMPPEAISFVPSDPNLFLDTVTNSEDFSAMAFTGSSEVFENIWKKIGNNISNYNSFPRIVGETGGMNYHFVFEDADMENVILSTVRGAFEYSGQKCSATSRIYLPRSKAQKYIDRLIEEVNNLKIGSPEEEGTFTSAVIHDRAYNRLVDVIKRNEDDLICGGTYSNDIGYYVDPTIFLCNDHDNEIMNNEFFGPVMGIYIYDNVEEGLNLCRQNKYALTGSVFTRAERNVHLAQKYLEDTCGNFYLNYKCTGSVVFQQPFGGSKKSGTNDKAGSRLFLTRFGNNKITKLKDHTFPVHQL